MSLRTNATRPADRRGSTLIIVIALLASLMLLGFLFLTISSQEQESAYMFSNAAKVPQYAGSDYFDFALEQLILGARNDYYNSALWGGRASLLPTMFGNDLQPFNGAGVNLSWHSGGYAVVDQEFNGPSDAVPGTNNLWDAVDDDLISINLSPAAWLPVDSGHLTTLASTPGGMTNWPAADVEYTTPDLASPFLTYISYEPTTGKRIVIPAFHRPQYLRDLGIAPGSWYTDPATARRTMRPHRAHVAVTEAGNLSGETRFVDGGADAGDIGSFPFDTLLDGTTARDEGVWWGNVAAGTDPKFTADPDNDGLYESEYLDLNYPEQVSADGTKTFVPLFAFTVYDADGLFNLNAHGNAYGNIAMYDASGNPLPFGNADAAAAVQAGGPPVGGDVPNDYISRSNQAVGPHEVNASVGLDQPPVAGAAQLDQHERFFMHEPTSEVELANMEWWFLLAGRPELDASYGITSLHAGRWGEVSRLRTALSLMPYGASPNPIGVTNAMPYPGGSAIDDQTPTGAPAGNGSDAFFGAGSTGAGLFQFDALGQVFPQAMLMLPHEHPIDVRGQGTFVRRTPGGKTRLFNTTAGTPFWLPGYVDYAVPNALVPLGEPGWRDHLGGALVGTPPWMGAYSVASDKRIDHPNETTLDPKATSGGRDAIFSPGESATLQFSNSPTDQEAIAFSERLLTLAPYNFGIEDDGTRDLGEVQARRKMYATYSADTKTAGAPVHSDAVAFRAGDYDAQPANPSNPIAFPPVLATAPPETVGPGVIDLSRQNQPFRHEVQGLLRNLVADKSANPQLLGVQSLMRKLSVNHVTEQVTNQNDPAYQPAVAALEQRIRQRPLTPHPIGLPSTPIGRPTGLPPYVAAGPSPNPGFAVTDVAVANAGAATWAMTGNLALQEWHARRDRQNLARDIYVLLYALGKANTSGGHPFRTSNEITDFTTGTGPVYSLRDLREMAQFAVNVVDAMDEDDNITCFVYDLNLYDGYTNLDDGYASPIIPANHPDASAGQDADGDGLTDNDFYDQTPGSQRGMVYGVETQRLTLSEAMFVLTDRVEGETAGTYEDHVLTEWHDEKVRDFSFIELINPTPEPVELSGEHWQLAVRPQGATQPPASPAVAATAEERRLTLSAGQVGVGSNATYSIASAGDNHNRERLNPNDTSYDSNDPLWNDPVPPATIAVPSRMRVNPTETKTTVEGMTTFSPATWMHIAPFAGADLDLLNAPTTNYRINSATPNTFFFRDGHTEGAFRRYSSPTAPDTGNPEYADDGLLFLGEEAVRQTYAADSTTDIKVTVELRRRLNLTRTAPDATGAIDEAISRDNPWIVVDRMRVPLRILQLEDTDETATLQTALRSMTSRERLRPMWRRESRGEEFHDTTAVAPETRDYLGNSLGEVYAHSTTPFTIWQPHYNRPFASLGEVLGVPLYGPSLLTGLPSVPYVSNVNNPIPPANPGHPRAAGAGLVFSSTSEPTPVLNRTGVAAARVLFPDGGTGDSGSSIALGFYNNLWYRAFAYLNIPAADGGKPNYDGNPWFTVDAGFPLVYDQIRQQSDDIGGQNQRFGKLNLNTIRHPHVYAGMLDDFSVMARPTGQTPMSATNWDMRSALPLPQTETLDTPTLPRQPRQWWNNFLASRDGIDPYTNLILPGLAVGRTQPGSTTGEIIGRPFRSLTMAVRSEGGSAALFGDHWTDLQNSLADTVFRRLPLTDMSNTTIYPVGTKANVRGLFELGTSGEADSATFDYTVRYRLLSKVLNHSTTRSNVFLVFIDVKYFKAKVKYTTGGEKYVRIGEPDEANDDGTPRAFFVIDRTQALETIQAKDLPQNNQFIRPGATAPMITSSFARNPDGTPTFNWRDLVLSSVRIQ